MPKRKRNPNGAGSITRRKDGRYMGRAYVTTASGERVRKYVYGRTWEEAHEELVKLLSNERQGIPVPDRSWKVGEYLDYWLEHVVRVSKRPATYDLYETIVRLYLKPGLGKYALSRLGVATVQAFLNAQTAAGHSARKVQVMRTVLSSALTRAMREELVSRNVARLVEVPEAVPREPGEWSTSAVRRFLAEARSDMLFPAFVLIFYLGLRRGEALGLGWDDVDWDAGEIRVRWQLQRVNGRLQRRPVKSRAGRRVLPLLGVVRDALKEQADRQAEWGDAAGDAWNAGALVLSTRKGGWVEPRNFNRSFTRIRTKLGLREFRPHDARHTCASLLAELGVDPRTAMEILGHSRSAVTLEVYQRASAASRREAVRRVAEALGD
ncbi:site-specific integrase [Carbonactinospora thermoautotrophica]|uniref:tyrosine-type recombinase/integrase n=1 Tax=Carbonactinospora thermoautotrophica TaxID=1469144 RepID=UPI00226D96DE|nr:tyrosine-type recombinase/integrase [Carbonactinospora thermoautotrophica]MCX9189933.1 site-specific integrase [Carbonactinospora thermoautotrophica]